MHGNMVRVINVIDDYNLQYIDFDIRRSLPAAWVTREMNELNDFHDKSKHPH